MCNLINNKNEIAGSDFDDNPLVKMGSYPCKLIIECYESQRKIRRLNGYLIANCEGI